jgi:hypothetical protein
MKTNPLILLIIAVLTSFAFADDETDFTAQPPPNWVRNNPLGIGNYDYAGGKLRLTSPAVPPEIAALAGAGRVQLFAPTSYTQCVVSVDVVAWAGVRNFASIGLRLQNPGLGTTTGYSFTLVTSDGDVEIHRLDGETPTLISESTAITVQEGQTYRLVFAAVGSVLKGRVYDLADLTTPIIEITASDSTYTQGVTALGVSTDALVPIDATFDNYLAWDGAPPQLGIEAAPSGIVIKANAIRSLASNIERASELYNPWLPEYPFKVVNGTTMEYYPFTFGVTQRFFRLKLMGAP